MAVQAVGRYDALIAIDCEPVSWQETTMREEL
jgi:hypothetical protein